MSVLIIDISEIIADVESAIELENLKDVDIAEYVNVVTGQIIDKKSAHVKKSKVHDHEDIKILLPRHAVPKITESDYLDALDELHCRMDNIYMRYEEIIGEHIPQDTWGLWGFEIRDTTLKLTNHGDFRILCWRYDNRNTDDLSEKYNVEAVIYHSLLSK